MNLLFYGEYDDQSYLPQLKGIVGTHSVRVRTKPAGTITELEMYARELRINSIFTTSKPLLEKLLGTTSSSKSPSIDNYAGSMFKRNGFEYVFVHPLKQLVTVPYAKFLTKRFISKFTEPGNWFPNISFNWEILDATNSDRIFDLYSNAVLIAVDIETYKRPLSIRCVGYTAIFISDIGTITSHSCVCPLDSSYNLAIVRKFNWELKSPKVMQNGKYDSSYLCMYNAPVYNWLWDTVTMFHAWYSELPKDLGFLGAFFVREAMYWKDLANTSDLHEYYLYNCRDTWTTAIAALAWIIESPEWAKSNYLKKFPLNFPSHLIEMTGIKRDPERLATARAEIDTKIAHHQKKLDTMIGANINVNSHVQIKKIAKILGLGKTTGGVYYPVPSSDENSLKKYSFLHPLNNRIFNEVLEIRGYRKLKSQYLRTDEDEKANGEGGAKEYKGRILYSNNPHGTDTGRSASKEHHFWCGLNITNITRGKIVKQTFMSDEDFVFGECDLKQAESRDVAYISGDAGYIAAVSGTDDFHSVNASSFFGRAYDTIYDNALEKVIDKVLRDLSKRTNHGATYCMQAGVLLDTMGPELASQAQVMLGLPPKWSLLEVTGFLLERFHKTYPTLESIYYPGIWHEVLTTNMLVGATGWVRYCFYKPTQDDKRARNMYVAHVSQSLNAMTLDQAFMRIFYLIAMHPKHGVNFKLCAPIHDSTLFQFRIGHEYLCKMVADLMEIPVTVKSYDGVTRTFTVPTDIKAGPDGKGVRYWSETE